MHVSASYTSQPSIAAELCRRQAPLKTAAEPRYKISYPQTNGICVSCNAANLFTLLVERKYKRWRWAAHRGGKKRHKYSKNASTLQ